MKKRMMAASFAALLLASSPASAAWLEAKSRHFIIYSEQKPEELRAYAARLEKFDLAVRKARGIDDPPLSDSNRLTVYVLANQPAVADLAGAPGVAGFYIARASGPIAFVHRGKQSRDKWDLEAETVFFHEYLHHLMLQSLQLALPHWMVEGYAEFFATAEILDDGSVRFGQVPTYRANTLFAWGNQTMSLQDMVGVNYRNIDPTKVVSVYGLGWLLTHYLTFEPSRRGQATKYAMAIQRGTPALQAAKEAFGDLGKLGTELERYLARKTVSTVTIPASDITVGNIAVRPLNAAETAIVDVRMRSERGVDKRSAPRVAADARRVAARFPNHAVVQAALAEAESDAENYQASIAAADRAIAADPNNTKALIYKGRTLMALGKKDPAKADWSAIRKLFAAANRVDPDDPEPLMLFYQTYKAQGARATANAAEGLIYAHELVPQDQELRLLVVRQFLAENNAAKAKAAFSPIAYNPHLTGRNRQKIIAVMDALVANNVAQATALLDQLEKEAEERAG